ncbi:MAG: FRG domain-containing protein [Planctomycetes bacterium]|nr:FRG domain-containing protein [Planctomycetota bacterium]
MKSIRINNVNDLMNVVYATMKKFGGQHLWWRGQAQQTWDLTPVLYQKGFAANEHNLALLFLNKAKVRYSKCPEADDRRSWLLLMHQYGLPTRLLNWSESVLVAAYFAVSEKKFMDETGTLWGLEPTKLNEAQDERKRIMLHQDESVCHLFNAAFEPEAAVRDGKTFAILTDQTDVRQVVQFSTYTIHGSQVPINKMNHMEKFLVEYEIPASAKPHLLQSLELLGIKKSFLFPDLKHLADDLQTIEFD